MKLIIQIPCLNEAETLPITLAELPKEIDGIDTIEILIIDDGSKDRTADIAGEHGAHHVLRFNRNRGLAQAFLAGLDRCTQLGADIVVNTDADNQYRGSDIPRLVRPILDGQADIVIGSRDMKSISHFSFIKKKLQKLGSWLVSRLAQTSVPDTTSGFRAFSREAILRLNVLSHFSYTLETIIQAGKMRLKIESLPITVNGKLRESRLAVHTWSYVKESAATIVRIYVMYEPLKTFMYIGFLIMIASILVAASYFVLPFYSSPLLPLLIGGVLFLLSMLIIILGIIADLISANRKLNEEILYRIRKQRIEERHRSEKPEYSSKF
ncbi:glycosyltransferase family 2 protein [candidate division KSB1 bacterium]